MPRREVIYDAALDDFIGYLAACPVRDRSLARFGLLASERHDLANLICRDPWRCTGSGEIGQALFNAEFAERDRL